MQCCLSEAVTLGATFEEDVVAYAGAGWPAMEVWLTKLEQHLETHSLDQTRDLLRQHPLKLAAAAYQGGLLLSQGEARKAHFDHFRRRLELCQGLEIPTLLLVGEFSQPIDRTAFSRALVSLKQSAQWAAGFGIRLALEFRGSDTICSCLSTAIRMVEDCGEENLGVNLDLFHYYRGPSKPEDFDLLTPANLAHVQLCDVAGVPREWMVDADRIFPGEGDFHFDSLMNRLVKIDYEGFLSVEVINPEFFRNKPSQVAELAFAAMRRFIS